MRRSSQKAPPDRRLLPFLDALAEIVAADVLSRLGDAGATSDEPGAGASDAERAPDTDDGHDDVDIRLQLRQAAPNAADG